MKKCPFCAEAIQTKAIICKHCKNPLPEHKTLLDKGMEIHKELQNKEADKVAKMSDTERKVYSKEQKRKWGLGIFWFLAISIALPLYVEPQSPWAMWSGFLILLIGIWIYPLKGESWFGEGGRAVQNRLQDYKTHKFRTGLSAVAFLFATLSFVPHLISDIQENKEWAAKQALLLEEQEVQQQEELPPTSESGLFPVEYEIVETEDLSRKAMTKLLSEYTTTEIEQLPTDKKLLYRILVSPEIKEKQVKPTVDKIIAEISTADKDIDEIALFLYSDRELAETDDLYDVAKATWAPLGKLGNVTPEIAQNNLRGTYQTTIEIKENLEEYLTKRNVSEDKFGLTEERRREIFRELVMAEDRGVKEAENKYPTIDPLSPDYTNELFKAQMDKQWEYTKELQKVYKAQTLVKYGIDEEIAKQINIESMEEGWPLPEY